MSAAAILFPGQGAQTPGFLHALPTHPAVTRTLEEASDTLHQPALALDSAEALRSTVGTQLALVIAGAAFARFLAEASITPIAVAGMSIGSYSAAIAAGSISFADALRLARHRAELMQTALPPGTSGMAVIEGLLRSELDPLLVNTPLVVANENASRQFVLSGPTAPLLAACAQASEAGATRAEPLRVAVASHGPWLAPAAEALSTFAAGIPIHPPRCTLFGNLRGRRLATADAVRAELTENLAHTVSWSRILHALAAENIQLYVEAPPGHTLSGLVRDNLGPRPTLAAAERRWDSILRELERSTSSTT